MVDLVVRRLTYKCANKTVIIYPVRGVKRFLFYPDQIYPILPQGSVIFQWPITINNNNNNNNEFLYRIEKPISV